MEKGPKSCRKAKYNSRCFIAPQTVTRKQVVAKAVIKAMHGFQRSLSNPSTEVKRIEYPSIQLHFLCFQLSDQIPK